MRTNILYKKHRILISSHETDKGWYRYNVTLGISTVIGLMRERSLMAVYRHIKYQIDHDALFIGDKQETAT